MATALGSNPDPASADFGAPGLSRKRSRALDAETQPCAAAARACEGGAGALELGRRPSGAMSRTGCFAMERTFTFEVSALRQAAAAAVAEFTGPQGPSLQLTASAKPGDLQLPAGADSHSEHSAQSLGRRRATGAPGEDLQPGPDGAIYTQRGCPPHGAKAICGRRPRMEDAYTAVPFLLEVPIPAAGGGQPDLLPPRIAPGVRSSNSSGSPSGSDAEEAHSQASSASGGLPAAAAPDASYLETLHFFGVFDGHGGAEAALHCAQTLHQRIAEALAAETQPASPPAGAAPASTGGSEDATTLPGDRPAVLRPGGLAEPEPAASGDQLDGEDAMPAVDGVACSSASFESALTHAFNRTDEEFGKADNAALVGTTAVVTLVGSRQLYVANCGDSRAVLCRAGLAIPLTDDHKAAREDETARVEAAGGQILFWNGVRVMGVLAVSRAIGDHCLRPYVIAQPEVTILARRPDDELLLLASDGLWDVLSNQEACTLAKRCLRRARQRHASRQSAARIAATVLTRAAVDRGSRDNVTVLVVDLSSGAAEAADSAHLDRSSSIALADDAPEHEHEMQGMDRACSQELPSRA